jgi:hypothetical protein
MPSVNDRLSNSAMAASMPWIARIGKRFASNGHRRRDRSIHLLFDVLVSIANNARSEPWPARFMLSAVVTE